METTKLRVKIGDREFEAEGPSEIVQAQFAAFKELAAQAPALPSPQQQEGPSNRQESATSGSDTLPLDRIMKTDGRVVSLTATANSFEDSILLILLGQKSFRNNDEVTGGEIIDGLRMTGQAIDRIDSPIGKLVAEGHTIVTGVARGKRYRLTNTGMSKAQEIAKAVIATVA